MQLKHVENNARIFVGLLADYSVMWSGMAAFFPSSRRFLQLALTEDGTTHLLQLEISVLTTSLLRCKPLLIGYKTGGGRTKWQTYCSTCREFASTCCLDHCEIYVKSGDLANALQTVRGECNKWTRIIPFALNVYPLQSIT